MRRPPLRRLRHVLWLMVACLLGNVVRGEVDESRASKLYGRGQAALSSGDLDGALDCFYRVARTESLTSEAAQALWEIARIQTHLRHPLSAFDALDHLVRLHPGHFEKAHEAQLDLVMRVLRSERAGAAALESKSLPPKVPEGQVVAWLSQIELNGPYSETGRQAAFLKAVELERTGQVKAALDAYETFIDVHPDDIRADDAAYQAAYIRYKEWRREKGGSSEMRDRAALALAMFLARYPESDKKAAAKTCVDEISAAEASELLGLALAYERRGDPAAAAVYFTQFGERFPGLVLLDEGLRAKIARAVRDFPKVRE